MYTKKQKKGALTWKLCINNNKVISFDGTEGLSKDIIVKVTNDIVRPVTHILSCKGDKGIAPTIMFAGIAGRRDTLTIMNMVSNFYNYLKMISHKCKLGSMKPQFLSIDYSMQYLESLNQVFNGKSFKWYQTTLHKICLGEFDINVIKQMEITRFIVCKEHLLSDPKQYILRQNYKSESRNVLISLTLTLMHLMITNDNYENVVIAIKLYIWFLNKKSFVFNKRILSSSPTSNTIKTFLDSDL